MTPLERLSRDLDIPLTARDLAMKSLGATVLVIGVWVAAITYLVWFS